MTNEAIEKSCPDQGVLVDFLQGKLVPPELENCESHLEDCDVCQETLSGINASDTLSDVVAKAMGPHTPSTDDAEVVQSLVRRLGKPVGFSTTRSDLSSKELLRDRAAEVLLHVAPDPEDDDSLGLLAGFRLRELLGSGGTGVVFRAYDLALDREIALKVLRPSLGDLARDRFVAEARAAASLDHENVVAIHQVGEQKRLAWIVMKWVPGETLESRLVREGSLGEEEVRQISIQIAKGLAEAHRQQLVHRDIKPANVWIGEADGKVLILDFGLVRITDNDPALTATGMLAGTPNFMSPEQAKGQELDARSDLFSLGCVMYQMITSTLPFGSPTILATLQSIQTQQPERPNLFADDCSEDLSDLTMALLEKQPANRVDSAESLVRCLETPRSDWSADMKRRMAAKRELNETALKPTTTQGSRFGAGSLIAAVLLGLFGFGLWFFAPQIIRIATNHGELVIETDDENVQVTVSQDGEKVHVLDADSGCSFDIRSGEFQISAADKNGKTEFEVNRNQLTMKRGGREVVKVTQKKKTASSPSSSIGGRGFEGKNSDQTNAETADQSKLLYKGEQLGHWLQVLETDLDAQTQAEALRACAVLYLSDDQDDELVALLQSYIERNANLFQGEEMTTCFLGFEDSLRKLPAKKIADFFKLQLKHSDYIKIDWTFRGMTVIRSHGVGKRPTMEPFSAKLREELESHAVELLGLSADLDNNWTAEVLFRFLVAHVTEDTVSDETVEAITTVMLEVFKHDPWRMTNYANVVPKRVITAELFASVKDRLIATETPAAERDDLVSGLIKVYSQTEGDASFILEILAEVIANQMFEATPIRFVDLQKMKVYAPKESFEQGRAYVRKSRRNSPRTKYVLEESGLFDDIEISGGAIVARKLLDEICQRLLDERMPSPEEVAKRVLAILAKPADEQTADPAELEHYNELQIERDLEALKRFAAKQSGEFSGFIEVDDRTFGSDPNEPSPSETEKAVSLALNSGNKPNLSNPNGALESKTFDAWLQIAQTAKQADVKDQAIIACSSLCESDQQFSEVAKLLDELAESQPYRFERDGRPVGRSIIFFGAFSHLSAKRVCDFLELQLKNGSDQALLSTSAALNQWGNVRNNNQQELYSELVPISSELGRLASLREKPQSAELAGFPGSVQSLNDQLSNPETDDQAKALYKGKKLSEWIKVLEVDRDAQTQAEALKACAALYLPDDQDVELVALLQSYIERNANLFQGEEMTTCFLGFEDSLRKLPAKKVADFFKLQLKEGTTTSIDWVYRGMTYSRLPPKINRLVLAANSRRPTEAAETEARYRRRYIGKPVSKKLQKHLESDTVELLRLIAARDIGDDTGYLSNSVADRLLRFVASRLLKDPVSDDAIGSFKKILTKLDVNELSEALDVIPRNMLTAELFSLLFNQSISTNRQYELKRQYEFIYTLLIEEPVSDEAIAWIKEIIPKLDVRRLYELIKAMPRHIHIPELFVATKDRLFAAETSENDRMYSIYNLILLAGTTDDQTTFILDTFAEVVAKQLDARDSLEIGVSDRWWRINGSEGTSDRADAVRKLLNIICEQIIDPKTLLSLRSEIDGSSDRRATSSSNGLSNSSKLARTRRYIDEYFKGHDADKNGILEGDEINLVRNQSKYDTNRDGKIEKDEMVTVLAGTSMPTSTSTNLSSSQSRSKAAELAKKVLAILAKPSSNGEVADPTLLEDFKTLQIDHDIEALKKISAKQSGEFSRFIDIDKRKFEGDPGVGPTTEPKKAVSPPSIPSGEGS